MSELVAPSAPLVDELSPFRIRQLRLHEIGPFVDYEINLPPGSNNLAEVHIFTGANGSGKSTVLAAISALFASWPSGCQELAARSRTEFASITATIDHERGRIRLGPTARITGVEIANDLKTSTSLSIERNSAFEWVGGALRSLVLEGSNVTIERAKFGALAYSAQKQFLSGSLENYNAPQSKNTRMRASIFSRSADNSMIQWIANTLTNVSLAKSDGDLTAVEAYQSSLTSIHEAISKVIGASFEFRINRQPRELMALWKGENILVSRLPDGLKAVLSLIADIAMRLDALGMNRQVPLFDQPFILVLDEIDVHLHPAWQRQILPVLQRSFPNAQIFAATHSPFVVGSVADASVYTLDPKSSTAVAQKSGAGQSLMTVIQDIFNVDEQFDPETEALFRKFYEERNRAIKTKQLGHLKELGESLGARGDEVEDIVNSEIHQVERKIALSTN